MTSETRRSGVTSSGVSTGRGRAKRRWNSRRCLGSAPPEAVPVQVGAELAETSQVPLRYLSGTQVPGAVARFLGADDASGGGQTRRLGRAEASADRGPSGRCSARRGRRVGRSRCVSERCNWRGTCSGRRSSRRSSGRCRRSPRPWRPGSFGCLSDDWTRRRTRERDPEAGQRRLVLQCSAAFRSSSAAISGHFCLTATCRDGRTRLTS